MLGLKDWFPQFLTETKLSFKFSNFLNKQYKFTERKKVIQIAIISQKRLLKFFFATIGDFGLRTIDRPSKNTIAQGQLGKTRFFGETSQFEPLPAETHF